MTEKHSDLRVAAEFNENDAIAEPGTGTHADVLDMKRMGKKQQLKVRHLMRLDSSVVT